MQMFKAKITWYDDFTDKMRSEAAVILGESFSNAMDTIEKQFDNIDDISLNLINYDCAENIVFLGDSEDTVIPVIFERIEAENF